MFRPRIIPVLLIKGNGLVKTLRFNKRKATYIGDPINAVRLFNDLEADELIILDITASLEKRTFPPELVKKIGDEAFMPFSVGGGIATIQEIQDILANGAEKVVINTSSFLDPWLIAEASGKFGNQSIIASMDLKKNYWGKYQVYIKDGTKFIETDPLIHAKKMETLGAGELLVNFIDRDGRMQGYDVDYLSRLSGTVSIPVIVCGGAGNLEHMAKGIKIGGASAAAAGSLFVFHGERKGVLINYPNKKELFEIFR
jgi:imidazole glycerol-phosphate synthase subunit HisF